MKTRQIRAQFEEQSAQGIRTHTGRRVISLIGAAAAAIMIGGTVTVGAVNNWDYSAVFSKYFAEKSGEQVSYDFTGMGLDIGEKIEGDGFTMTVQSVMADASNVYIAYDVELSDEFNAIFAAYDDAELSVNMASLIEIPGDEEGRNNEFLNRGGAAPRPVCDEEGVWHCMEVIAMDFGTGLNGTRLRLAPIDEGEPLCICYGYSEEGKGQTIELSAPDFELCYDLSGITVQPGMTAHYGGTLPNDANENIFDDLILTPFMLKFVASGHIGVFDTVPQWGMVWGDEQVPVSLTAVYADGTERALIQNTGAGSGGGMSCRNPDGGYDWELRREYYIATPFTLDGLTAIRINGAEIPLT
ncbi:MAG: DUF4179 domain-containing protein [Oscillospiraceae bacterium]|nr:DUF4179 domain-containing protein [Oscillospiraceae bacterium]